MEFSKKVFSLCKKLEVPENLSGLGITRETVNLLLDEIGSLDRAFAQNPVPFTVEDGKNLIRSMI
jgi:alcohol dehydrogenase class IV